jgi:hypothetical protein
MFMFVGELLFSQSVKKDSIVTFRVINGQSGAMMEGLETAFSVSSTDSALIKNNISDTEVKSTRSGSIDLQLIKNTSYRASVSFLKNGVPVNNGIEASDGKYYVIPRETILFAPSTDLRTFFDFVLSPSKTLLDVVVVDDEGKAVESGYVQAYAEAVSNSEEDTKGHVVGDRIVNGGVTLPVLPNRTYQVSFNASLPGLVSPEEVQVVVGGSGRYGLKLPMKSAEHSIVATAMVEGSMPKPDVVSLFFCYANNESGQYVKGRSSDGVTVTLMVENTQGAAWRVGCQMSLYRNGAEVFYKGEVNYEVNGQTLNSLTVPLEEVKGYFPETAYGFSGGAETTIKAPDGKAVLTVPATLFSNEDNINVVLQTGRGYVVTSNSAPLLAYDIKFYKNGSPVTELGVPVLISIPLNEDEVKDLEGSVDDVYPASYDEESGRWVRETNYTYDESTGTIKIYASHFSIWGLLVDLAKTLRSFVPTNLRVKVPQTSGDRRRVVRLYWDKAVNGDNSGYQVQVVVRSRQVLTSNKGGIKKREYRYFVDWAKAKVLSPVSAKARIALLKGAYQFRVKTVDGTFSKPKQFRVR